MTFLDQSHFSVRTFDAFLEHFYYYILTLWKLKNDLTGEDSADQLQLQIRFDPGLGNGPVFPPRVDPARFPGFGTWKQPVYKLCFISF